MRIDSHTPQAELEKLYMLVTRQELLRNTPLNVKIFLRYAVLFIFFPGMIIGFWAGWIITFAFILTLIGFMLADMQEQIRLLQAIWLGCGLSVFAYVTYSTLRAAVLTCRLRRRSRVAEKGRSGAATQPGSYTLRWKLAPDGSHWLAEFALEPATPGIVALMLELNGAAKRQLLSLGKQGECLVQHSPAPDAQRTLLLYKLADGRHQLRWALTTQESDPPVTTLTLLHIPGIK